MSEKPKGEVFFDAKFGIEAMQNEPYQSGFTWKTVIGSFFVAFVMLPGIIFMGLMIGEDLGNAADWVTIILFVEIARRSFVQLRKQELYILKYTISQFSHISGGIAVGGGMFGMMVIQRYFRNSEAYANFGIGRDVPNWYAPYGNSAYEPFTNMEVWGPVLLVMVASAILGKLTMLSLGYLIYKVVADVEKLPFPMAPIHAEGAIALAETSSDSNQRGFRQYCFSIGVMCGAVFGLFYMAIPALSNAFLGKTVQLLPVPFWDLTHLFERFLTSIRGEAWGGGVIGLSFNLGLLFVGFVLPWRIVIGGFTTVMLFQIFVNPMLQRFGYMPHWKPGKDAIEVTVASNLDIYLSIGIGTSLAIFVLGVWSMVRSVIKFRNNKARGEVSVHDVDMSLFWKRNIERGDPPTWIALVIWVCSALGYIWLSNYLINGNVTNPNERFPVWFFFLFAFGVTPLQSYINARMSGIAGQYAGLPFVAQAAIFLSDYKKVDIWYAPLPIANYGGLSDHLRVVQLTRTKFTSVWLADLFVFPISLIASFIFWSYITGLGPIPSDAFPYVQKFWPQHAQMSALWASSKLEGGSLLLNSINLNYILLGLIGVVALFSVFNLIGISVQYIYGGLGAMNAFPHTQIPVFLGALLGRFYFAKKFGRERWQNFAPILAVGFGAGMGLIGMFSIAINFLWVSIGTGY